MSVLHILENNINGNIQCNHSYTYSSSKHKICTWDKEESWEMIKTIPDVKQKQNPRNHSMQIMYICSKR